MKALNLTHPNSLKKHYQNILEVLSQHQNHWASQSMDVHKNKESQLIEEQLQQFSDLDQIRLRQELYGLGPLENLISKADIDEILIHGQTAISYERQGQLYSLNDSFLSSSSFLRVFEMISNDFFKSISYENPTGNGYWKGFRVHVMAPPLSRDIQVSMRRIGGSKIKSLEQLAQLQFVAPSGLDIIFEALKMKKNILICGATSSGKTTFIQCLMNSCKEDRFVILEDSEELYLPNSLSTSLICPTRQEQYNLNFTMKDLVKESLRMRPDRIVLGEARSDEAKDYIQALSTGHKGCLASIHAASPKEALIRLECLISQGAPNWPPSTIRQLIASGLDLIIHVQKNNKGLRHIQTISEISSLEHNGILLHELYTQHNS